MKKPTPIATSVRVSPTCKILWDRLSIKLGLSNTGTLETAIRLLAKQEGVDDKPEDEEKQ